MFEIWPNTLRLGGTFTSVNWVIIGSGNGCSIPSHYVLYC